MLVNMLFDMSRASDFGVPDVFVAIAICVCVRVCVRACVRACVCVFAKDNPQWA